MKYWFISLYLTLAYIIIDVLSGLYVIHVAGGPTLMANLVVPIIAMLLTARILLRPLQSDKG